MPELPEVEAVRRTLEGAMRGNRITGVTLRRPDLRRPFPADFAARLTGQPIRAVARRGKYLLVHLGSGETLLIHLGMSGSFAVAAAKTSGGRRSAPAAFDPHDHVVFVLSSGVVVTFNDPRRFGIMDLIPEGGVAGHQSFRSMGPEPLDEEFDAAVLARVCASTRAALKVVLMDQRHIAGLGNIYASEALHRAGLSPRRRASTLATRSGAPRDTAFRLAAAIKSVLRDAVARRQKGEPSSGFRVYERDGERCVRRSCTGTIRRITQAGRSTYFCPTCQG